MRHTLKGEVLTPLMIIHGGIILLIGIIFLRVPSDPAVAGVLLLSAGMTVGGSIALWRFVVSELISIRKCHDAITTGKITEFHSDRDDELGELEEDLSHITMRSAS